MLTDDSQNGSTGSMETWIQIGGTVLQGAAPSSRSIAGVNATVLGINASGTVVNVDSAALFRVGDMVVSDSAVPAQITQIVGNALTLNAAIPKLAPGNALRTSAALTAWVAVEKPNGVQVQRTTTDTAGRFIFGGVQPGSYVLRARATGLGEVSRPIDVPSPSGEYDLKFP
jgi:hypothetical protein